VAAEEKKSLPSSDRRLSRSRQTGFRLHYFPDIPVDGQVGVRHCAPTRDDFQRTQYDSNDAACQDPTASDGGQRPLARRTALTAAERVEQAYQKGLAEGNRQGLKDGEQNGFERASRKVEPLITAIQQAVIKLTAIREETYQQIETEVVELALAIARKIICREVSTDKETVVCVAKEALAKVDDPGKIKIKMNPADLQFINETKYQLSNLIADVNNVTIEAEESIQSGGCVIETDLGEIDARIEKQLQAVEESFRGARDIANPPDPIPE
jgi:flagellar assembly protein FliH